MTHKLIAIEGIHQTERATLAENLRHRLTTQGRPARIFTFPVAEAPTGRILERLETQRHAPGAELAMLLRIANLYERRDAIKAALKAGSTVICDGYTAACTARGEAEGLEPGWIEGAHAAMPVADETILVTCGDARGPGKLQAAYEKLAYGYGWIGVDGDLTPTETADQAWAALKTVLEVTATPLATYGNRGLQTEVRIYRDEDCPNPLHNEKRLQVLTLGHPGNPLGDRQMGADELAETVKAERKAGRPVYAIYTDAEAAYHYTMKDTVDEWEKWMSGIIVAANGWSDTEDRMKAEAQQTLEQYGLWLNRHTYRYEEWRVPGDPEPSAARETHSLVNARRGFIGESHITSGVLEAAGVVDEYTRELAYGWKTIVT